LHPAKSVILFTTLSGAGYGIFAWLSVLSLSGNLDGAPVFMQVSLGLAFGLVVTGLFISALHLKHPERAWRALSQWRSSWLSREGVLAILTFMPAAVFAGNWLLPRTFAPVAPLAATLTLILSLATVFATAMIYATLKAIPAWSNRWTVPGYLLLSLMTGVIILNLTANLFAPEIMSVTIPTAVILLFAGLTIKLVYWSSIRFGEPVSTAETATGLGALGRVTLLESPHSGPNYLMREMGFGIARKHAKKLRLIVIVVGFLLPLLIFGGGLLFGVPAPSTLAVGVAFFSSAVGIFIERWLFFAEAKHVVTLYYGSSAV
jgi:DMSO reductase anchor subunit